MKEVAPALRLTLDLGPTPARDVSIRGSLGSGPLALAAPGRRGQVGDGEGTGP